MTNEEFDAIVEDVARERMQNLVGDRAKVLYERTEKPEPGTDTEWAGDHWPRVTVILVSRQDKMDKEDQGLLSVIKSYEDQEYDGPLDINIVLQPACDQRLSEDVLRAVGVKQADPGIVVFVKDDEPFTSTAALFRLALLFTEAWPEQVVIKGPDETLLACTQGHYMREIYDEVMK